MKLSTPYRDVNTYSPNVFFLVQSVLQWSPCTRTSLDLVRPNCAWPPVVCLVSFDQPLLIIQVFVGGDGVRCEKNIFRNLNYMGRLNFLHFFGMSFSCETIIKINNCRYVFSSAPLHDTTTLSRNSTRERQLDCWCWCCCW